MAIAMAAAFERIKERYSKEVSELRSNVVDYLHQQQRCQMSKQDDPVISDSSQAIDDIHPFYLW